MLGLRSGASAALLLSIAACSSEPDRAGVSPGDAPHGDSLYIAVAAARTEANAAYFRGVELAVERLNAGRAAGVRPLAVRLPPAEQSSQVAVAAEFRDDPAVVGVVGHTGSAQTMEAAPIYGDVEHGGRHAVAAVTPTATNPRVTRASDWVFRVCPTDEDGAKALARFAADSLRARRVAVIYRNDLFGRGFTRVFASALAALGTPVLERDPYLAGITEFDAYAERVVGRGVDALVIAGGASDAAEIIRAVHRAGARPAVLGTDDVAGLGADTAAAREFGEVRYTAFYLADQATAAPARAFAAAYRARFGAEPDHRAALSYDAAMLIGRAAATVGPDRRKVRDWLAAVGRTAPPYEGVTGPIRFSAWGDAVNKPVLIGAVGR